MVYWISANKEKAEISRNVENIDEIREIFKSAQCALITFAELLVGYLNSDVVER